MLERRVPKKAAPPPRPAEGRRTDERRLLSGRDSRTEEFLRVMRIGGEFVRGFRALHFVGPCVTFFGSARFGEGTVHYERTRRLAARLGSDGWGVMTGGGPGLMEAANRGAREVGALSIGATIDINKERPNRYCDQTVPFHYFFARKVILVKYSYGFVHVPGGFGTLDELAEALTLIQTGKVAEFPTILFGTEYWCGLRDWIADRMLGEGAIGADDLERLVITDDEEQVAEILQATAGHLGLQLTQKAG
jgi:uncharacterized protein (TIGR00730 family)